MSEATVIHHFNTYTSISATKAKSFTDDTQADILLSGITTIDNPAARNLYLDVTSTNPIRVTYQEFISRTALDHQPGPGEHDPRNDVLTSAKRGEAQTRQVVRRHLRGNGVSLVSYDLPTVYFLFAKQLRDSGLPADVPVGKLKKDISFALRRGTLPK
jgi:hypothetical protein